MIHTTLSLLELAGACGQKIGSGIGYDKVRQYLGKDWKKDAPIALTCILDSNGLADALWCLRAVLPQEEKARNALECLLVCDYAEHVLPIWAKRYPKDKRPDDAIRIARLYAQGKATREEIAAAKDAVGDAVRTAIWDASDAAAGGARAAWVAAWVARNAKDAARGARAAWGIRAAAWDAAWAAAWGARAAAGGARDAAWDAARIVWDAAGAAEQAARDAARAAAWDAAWDAEQLWQTARLREYLEAKP